MARFLLIADSDQTRARYLSQILPHFGYRIEIAKGGIDCVNQLRQARPDLLLLDLDLLWGGSDGVLAWLQEESPCGPMPPVLLIGASRAKNLRTPLSSPVVSHISNPFASESLMRAIQDVCAPKS